MPHLRAMPSLLTTGLMTTALILGLSACADRPDLSGRVAPVESTLAWPSLLDTTALAQSATDATAAEDSQTQAQSLEARAAALRSRARRLSQTPILSTSERRLLLSAIARLDAPQ
ncbi:hypothetical protein HCZ23_01890 [Celeribacter sp. HF31]|uniref:hypothetical protein n=1 Tax=Celeribacter sp. HF31 TaxID=2721558 RepID=UPI001C376C4B|nr:hypothetical protein [Celeribacter sp. HF31]NIY78221.1 hypothetical protein [Celeribacter sp. HF31]